MNATPANVIQPGNDFAPGKFLDLQMLIFPGGCERTEKQLEVEPCHSHGRVLVHRRRCSRLIPRKSFSGYTGLTFRLQGGKPCRADSL